VWDGDAGGGIARGTVTFTKNEDGTYNLAVDGVERAPGLVYEERTKTLVLPDGTRAISYWEPNKAHLTPPRIFGARKGVKEDDLLPFEKGDNGSWGAEEGPPP
jgi:hypothetical protein